MNINCNLLVDKVIAGTNYSLIVFKYDLFFNDNHSNAAVKKSKAIKRKYDETIMNV